MDGTLPVLILLAAAAILSGPIALIVALVALKRIEEMRHELRDVVTHRQDQNHIPRIVSACIPGRTAPEPIAEEPSVPQPDTSSAAGGSLKAEGLGDGVSVDAGNHPQASLEAATRPHSQTGSLEQRIGTRWVLVAGVITVVFAVGFFLKYAYESEWIGPWGRVMIAGLGGLVALALGEVTRRRGYDFVAKGVTALGFAILYATVFAAHRWYGLIGPAPAYVLAVAVTAAAMLYAVVLDEVTVALLSLAGGYLTPLVLSTGQNLPNLLFGYVLILSTGAMLCAYWRTWSPVNILAFLGTYLLYTAWFEKFYRPLMDVRWPPPQLGVGLFWLAVFFLVFLVLPVLHTLLRRVRAQVQSTLLVLANAAVVFYYLWTMLSDRHQDGLASCSLAMGTMHLGLMGLVTLRCRADADLRNALLIAGLAFVSLAIPLYFRTHTIAALWAVEAVGLTTVGLRYRNTLVQLAAGAVLALALGMLITELPLHAGPFRPVLNAPFGTWCFVAVAALACHLLFRFDLRLDAHVRRTVAELLYTTGLFVLIAAVSLELWHYGDLFRKGAALRFVSAQMPLVQATAVLLLAARPLRPKGPVCPGVATAIGVAGSVFLVLEYAQFAATWSVLFVNTGFLRAMVMVAAVFAAAGLVRRAEDGLERRTVRARYPILLLSAGILVLWIVMTEEIWLHHEARRATDQWRFLAQMYISVLWAVYASVLMVLGFWQRVKPLRYLSLGIFLLLLAKIFLVDTRTVETVYRIAGFLVTGLALVGVSYLYQYLRKKGFFEAIR